MPGVLTHMAVVKLAQNRLADIQTAIAAKLAAPGARVSDLDHRVLFLAERAFAMLSTTPVPNDPAAAAAREISRFAVMGSAGPSIPGAGLVLVEGHDWVHDTLHTGTPDEHRERVVARSTDFVLAFWKRVSAGIDAQGLGPSETRAALQSMQAYVMGHLCHVATDVVSGPYLDDVEFHLGLGRQPGVRLGASAGPIDARVAIQVFQRTGPRDGPSWQEWWPPPDTVPAPFYEAYRQAFEDVYGAVRIAGSAEFQERMATLNPPLLSTELIRDGYDFYYHGVVGIAYGFDHWKWALVFLPLVLAVALELIIFPLLPAVTPAFATAPWNLPDTERTVFELLAFPSLIIAPASIVYAIAGAVLTNRSVSGLTVFGVISAIVSAGGLAGFFATLETKDENFSPGWRWFLLFVVPLLGPLVFFILALVNNGTPVGALEFLYGLPVLSLLFSAAAYFTVFLPIGLVSDEAGASPEVLVVEYILVAIGVLIAVILAWLALVRYITNSFMPDMADETFEQRRGLVQVSRLRTDRPHMARLFEDTTLFLDPAVVAGIIGAAPPLAADEAARRVRTAQFFPSHRRKLIKLWWNPAGTVFVRSDRFQLVFSDRADGSGQTQVVPAPVVPSTVAEYVALLNGTVINVGVAGALRAAAVFPADLDYELPPGATFADHGDEELSTGAHDEKAATFKPLGNADDPTAYVLFHAPRSAQSIRFGHNGPIPGDDRDEDLVPGEGTVESDGTEVRGSPDALFTVLFRVGDRLRAAGQTREVTLIRSDRVLIVESTFSPDLPAGTGYFRVGEVRERAEGYTYVADPAAPGGETLMDYAGDLAALLCMGAVSHLLPANRLKVRQVRATAAGETIDPVYQVFRNWNLDHRRVNEWRMLVAGRSFSEKQNDSRTYDAAMTDPRRAAYRPRQNDEGARTADQLGWVPLLRRWLRMTSQPASDPLGAAVPAGANAVANVALTRGIAYLLDLPEPVAMP